MALHSRGGACTFPTRAVYNRQCMCRTGGRSAGSALRCCVSALPNSAGAIPSGPAAPPITLMVHIFRPRIVRTFSVLLAGWGCLLVPACSDTDQVRSYTVEPVSQFGVSSDPASLDSPEQTPQAAWFFKLLGSADDVAVRLDEFDAFLESVRFGATGQPEWDAPAGWTEEAGNDFRFATLVIPDTDPPLEISVTVLPAPDPGSDVYLRQNVDRWRGQLGLSAYSQPDWRSEAEGAEELADLTNDDINVLRMNLRGSAQEIPDARMLAAVVWQTRESPGNPAQSPGTAPTGPPTYDVPEGWNETAPRAFQLALFTIGSGADASEASISKAGGAMDMNVNRWRGQVGLTPLAGDELTESLETTEVDGQPAIRAQIEGSEQTILAVIVPDGPSNWFFKLIGPTELVQQESERFDTFVQSIQFAE